MKRTGKSYTVKEWYANKIANEVHRSIHMCEVFGIIKETEKAVYAVLNLGNRFSRTTWVPKSVLVEQQIGETASGSVNYETLQFETFEEATAEFNRFWNSFN